MPPVLQQSSGEVLKGQFKPFHTRPLSSSPNRPRSTRGIPPQAHQGASENHIPANSAFAPQPRSALSQTAPPPSTSSHHMPRTHTVRAWTASIAALKLASKYLLASCPAPCLALIADGPAGDPLGGEDRAASASGSCRHRRWGASRRQPVCFAANVWSQQIAFSSLTSEEGLPLTSLFSQQFRELEPSIREVVSLVCGSKILRGLGEPVA